MRLLWWVCLAAFTQLAAADSRKKSVIVSVNAKWPSTSIFAETSEFLNKESPTLFWSFISLLGGEKNIASKWTDLTCEQKYDLSMKLAATSLGDSSLDLLKFSLSLRAFSPTVQLFQQMGEEYNKTQCESFFDVHGIVGCTTEELKNAVAKADKDAIPTTLSVDHIYPSKTKAQPNSVTFVYGNIGSPEWLALHNAAVLLADQGATTYALRHFSRTESSRTEQRVSLSGYGVELAIKNTEYKAEDDSNKMKEEEVEEDDLHGFNFKLLKETHEDLKDSLDAFRMHLKEIQELAPLKQWQVQDLSYQASQLVVNAEPEEAISVLKEYSQNFPLYARTLSRESVTKKMRDEIDLNQKEALPDAGVDPGDTALFLNGINLDLDSLDMFQLLDLLRQEERLSTGFYNMGFRREYLSMLVGMDLSDEKINYAIDYRDYYPFFLNNLDSDKQYKQWGNSVKLMLQPYYPGMLRPIARNLFTLIFVVDPSEKDGRNLLKIAHSFYKHELPIRIGIIFVVNRNKEVTGQDDAGVAILNLFNYLTIETSEAQALGTVNKMLEPYRSDEKINVENIRKWFEKNHGDADYNDVFGPKSDYDKGRQSGIDFFDNTGLGKAPKVLLNGFVLDDAGIKGDKFEETVMMEVMRITPKIQRAVMEDRLKDKSNVANWIMDQKDVMPRLNKRILDAPTAKHYLDLTNVDLCKAKTLSQFYGLDSREKAQCIVEKTKYLQRHDTDFTAAATIWIVADVENAEGRTLAYNAIKHLKHTKMSRVGFLLNPADETAACQADSISSYIQAALRLLPSVQAKQFITKLVKEDNVADLKSGKITIADLAVGGMNVEHFIKEMKLLPCDKMKMERRFVTEVVGFPAGSRGLIGNGMVIGPLEEGEELQETDLVLLEKLLDARGATVIANHVDKWEVEKTNGKSSDVVLRSSALIGMHAVARKRTWVVLKGDEHSAVTLVADDKRRATMDVVAIVDPLSTSAQKLAPILELLRSSINCDMKIVMNPKSKLSELPLKRFYRYVASPELSFDANGNISPNLARFTNLPSKQLITMSVHSPDAWMLENVHAEYDLDNIKMEQVSSDVVAIFSLEHILLEGHCFDEVSGSPPRGLQFVLGTRSNPAQYDTIVMANLGYFQLKATPGAWWLKLRDGRSKEIYDIVSHTETEGKEDDSVRVLIGSFSGRTIRVRVSKKVGMEERNLLSDENEEGGGIWSSISSSLVGEKHETINVFSLASGHLYERFMRIMILSVMKKTKHPVKFWLLKNYLSPQFKETLPLMAEAYGFEYSLVEYKWPRWLHQQKEKHRIMWGYKILFLDVLFPLDVQKIIFVDADQVVRADLMELMEFDLLGAPYGYVPFCESRKEMDGFRFWKQGYWANHLAGRRYHISALYVIDLHKFRQIAAGDRLRGQYQGLSSDPNSLSNLDQDLPNNMIHQVKIRSLPQEWLWCETWCDDGSKSSAKTIDLCNNPLTKEPKLDSAQRIIPEWVSYDTEIKNVLAKANQSKKDAKQKDEHIEL